jgi:hypothetical protein
LEIITKTNAEIAYHNQELWNFKEERQKFYEEIEMLQETINTKDKANKDLKEIVMRPQRSYNKLWGKVCVKEHKFNKELHVKDVKLQNLELIHKTLGKLIDWEKNATENQS